MTSSPLEKLFNFRPQHRFFIGIDSDGCVFDSMEIKHKECFAPNAIKHWNLQAVSKYARAAWEFVNLYSKWRGINRFPALAKVLETLRDWPEPCRRIRIPAVPTLDAWCAAGGVLSNGTLKAEIARTGDPVLKRTLEWSEASNKTVEEMVKGVPPFPFFRESVEKIRTQADIICVSATPGEALEREWAEHDIAQYAAVIAGQEMGSKTEHLKLAAGGGRYAQDHVLMIGDAPGDCAAAKANGALFFPINPGHEEESWERFYREAADRFFNGTYAGEYEAARIAEFDSLLPETPPWKR